MEFAKKGTYVYKTDRYEVVVNVPRTIQAEEVMPAFQRFLRSAARAKKEAANG